MNFPNVISQFMLSVGYHYLLPDPSNMNTLTYYCNIQKNKFENQGPNIIFQLSSKFSFSQVKIYDKWKNFLIQWYAWGT